VAARGHVQLTESLQLQLSYFAKLLIIAASRGLHAIAQLSCFNDYLVRLVLAAFQNLWCSKCFAVFHLTK